MHEYNLVIAPKTVRSREGARAAAEMLLSPYGPELDAYYEADCDNCPEGKPEKDCYLCEGTGKYETNNNPEGLYDWYQIGGRWAGFLDPAYDPRKDERNIRTCTLCNGTGTRPGGLEQFGQEWFDANKGCNGCEGTGKEIVWSTDWADCPGNIRRVSDVLALDLPTLAKLVPCRVFLPGWRAGRVLHGQGNNRRGGEIQGSGQGLCFLLCRCC